MHASLLLFILAGISSIYAGEPKTCNVFPKDEYVEAGESIAITCQNSCVAGKIYWTLNNRKINDSLSKALNSTHTVLSLSNFTHPSATLQCHSANTQQVIGGTTIGAYSKPRNISCIWHNTEQQRGGSSDLLTCTWEHQTHPSVAINYTVEGVIQPNYEKIKCSKPQGTKCTFEGLVQAPSVSVTITVNAKTAAWSVSSDPRTFILGQILKMLPPKDLIVTEENPGDLVVSWTRFSPLWPCDCKVRCSKVSAKGETVECDRNENENTAASLPVERTWYINVSKVESCTTYTFSVRCAYKDAPWSDWSKEKSYLTKLRMENVNLHLWRKVSELGKNGIRKVHVMWRGIPSTCEGIFNYTINSMNGEKYKLCGNTTCDVYVNQDARRINLKVNLDKGRHVEKSIYVPAVGESLPRVTDIQTSSNDNVIQISWKAPVEPVKGYVVDWTHNGGQYYWKETEHTNATLFDLLDKKPYNITVTPFFDDKTGQSTQALQVCSRFGDPDGIAFRVEAEHRSASVSWNTMSQGECSGPVVNYIVYYYESQNGPLLNVSADSKTKKASLPNLKPDTQYTVYVNTTALTGTTKSSERKFTTKKFDPRLLTVLIVSGTITIILVLLLGLCFAVQWKKFKEKPVPNPSLSSVGVWAAQSNQKRICFQPFSKPSESPCDTVYPDKAQSTPTPSLVTGSDTNTASNYTEDYTNSGMTFAPHLQDESPVEPVEMPPSPGESTALISPEGSPVNPYRSQSSVESPVPRAAKQSKHVAGKQQEKTPLKTVYVTLDMI